MIAVVVLTYAAPHGMLEDCLDALVAAGGAHIYVVDNGITAAARLDADARFVACELITAPKNLGYAGGMNIGIARALADGAETVAVLNDDVVVSEGWLPPLVAALGQGDRCGAAQPKLLLSVPDLEADGIETINSLGVRIGPDGAGTDIAFGEPDRPDSGPAAIEAFTGGAVAFSAAFLRDVGDFDERFFLYYEDVDLALRGAERGWTYVCVPASVVRHRGSATTSLVPRRTAYLRERNRLWVLIRHRPVRDLGRGLWLSIRRLRHPPRGVHARALGAGCLAAPRLAVARLRARRLSD